MNPKNFNSFLDRLKYKLLKPINYLNYINLKDEAIWENSFLKTFQWKTFTNLCIKKNCLKIIEFGSGRSTIFFLENYKNYELFQSVNPKIEEEYTDLVREEIKKKNLNNKNFELLNTEVEKENIEEKNTVNFKYEFETLYDIMYIDGPAKELTYNTNLIHNILSRKIKSKIYFFDGRHNVIDIFVVILKKNNIKYHLKHSHLLNYTIIEIENS